jgi:hypothetical protein
MTLWSAAEWREGQCVWWASYRSEAEALEPWGCESRAAEALKARVIRRLKRGVAAQAALGVEVAPLQARAARECANRRLVRSMETLVPTRVRA